MKKCFLLISLVVLSVAGCRKSVIPPEEQNILRISLSSPISTFDPVMSYDTVSATVIYQVHETLFQYHYLKRPYQLMPLLAKELPKITDDGMTYTIHLKKDISYHPHPAFQGKPRFVKAQDFINSFKRLAFAPLKSNGEWLFSGQIRGFDDFKKKVGQSKERFYSESISGLTALDDHTLKIELTRPNHQFLYTLAMTFTAPVPIELIRHSQNDLSKTLIGTGPFMSTDLSNPAKIVLKKNSNYAHNLYPSQGDRWSHLNGLLKDSNKKLPFVNQLEFFIIKEGTERWKSFIQQGIDILPLPKDHFNETISSSGKLTVNIQNKKIQLDISTTLTYWWLAFNMNDPLWGKNKLLRKAVAHAVNTEEYIKRFTNNIALKANSIYPPGIPGYDPSARLPYSYDLDKARELLKKAGYPKGKNLPALNFELRRDSTSSREQGEFIKNQLAQIGIKVNIIVNTFSEFLKKSQQGTLHFWHEGWALDYPDAENTLNLLYSKNLAPGPNSTNYQDPEYDRLFRLFLSEKDGIKKYQYMKELEEVVHENLPWIMQYYSRKYVLYQHRIKNYRSSDIIINYFKYLKIEP